MRRLLKPWLGQRSPGEPARTVLRSLLGIVLLLGFYILTFSILVSNVCLVLLPVITRTRFPGSTPIYLTFLVAMLLAPGLIVISTRLYAITRLTRKVPWPSVEVSRGQAPALWDMVDQVAGVLGVRPPRALYLGASANAEVTEDTWLLGLVVGSRHLYVGIPLILGLTIGEMRSVLGHELAHYRHGDTRFGAITYRSLVGLTGLRDSFKQYRDIFDLGQLRLRKPAKTRIRHVWIAVLATASLLIVVPFMVFSYAYASLMYGAFSACASWHERLVGRIRTAQEREADLAADGLSGSGIRAVRSVLALSDAWTLFVNDYLTPSRQAGIIPDDPFSAFEEHRRMSAERGRGRDTKEPPGDGHQHGPASGTGEPTGRDHHLGSAEPGGASADEHRPEGDDEPAALLLPANPVPADPHQLHVAVRRRVFPANRSQIVAWRDWLDSAPNWGPPGEPQAGGAAGVHAPVDVNEILARRRRQNVMNARIQFAVIGVGVTFGAVPGPFSPPPPPPISIPSTEIPPPITPSDFPTFEPSDFPPPSIKVALPDGLTVTLVTVRPGDTLRVLACRYQTTTDELQKLNALHRHAEVRAGSWLWVPLTHKIKRGCR